MRRLQVGKDPGDDWIYVRLGERIRFYREKAGLLQEELADRITLTRVSIVNIEAGRQRTPLHHLYAIAEVLGVEIADLLTPDDGESERLRQSALAKLTPDERLALGLPKDGAL